MRGKAKSNLQATDSLLQTDFIDGAMTRLYYSLFQAAAHWMEKNGKKPSDFTANAGRWSHATICGNATLYRGQKEDLSLFKDARSLREAADYTPVPVKREQVEGLRAEIEEFVSGICDEH